MPQVQRTLVERDPADVIEHCLTTVVRFANLPRVRERWSAPAGVALDASGYPILLLLEAQGPERLSDQAAHLGVDPSTLSRQVDKLERLGLVERQADPRDQRAVMVVLTVAGRRICRKLKATRRASIEEVLEGWTDAERELFAELIDRLASRLMALAE